MLYKLFTPKPVATSPVRTQCYTVNRRKDLTHTKAVAAFFEEIYFRFYVKLNASNSYFAIFSAYYICDCTNVGK